MGKPGQSRQAKFGGKGERGKAKKQNKSYFFFSKDAPSDTFCPFQSAKIYSEVP
jgi:hypothetical protein